MSRAQATAYLVALVGLPVGFILVVVSPGLGDTLEHLAATVAPLLLFVCFSAILGVAVMRVQRGEVAAERDDVLMPSMAEFVRMSLGGRVPMALASLSSRQPQ